MAIVSAGVFTKELTNASFTLNDGFAQKTYFTTQLRDELMIIYNGE